MSGSSNEDERLADLRCWLVTIGVLLPLQTLLLAWIACRYSPTSDEMAHLTAGVRILTERDFGLYTVNPPLPKIIAAVPVLMEKPRLSWKQLDANPALRREWNVAQDFMWANSTRSLWLYTLGRWASIPWAWPGLVICYLWARDLYGRGAGLAAATMWTFSPAILANGGLITPDIPAASMAVTTLYAFRLSLRESNIRHAVIAGICLGVAQLTKMTLLLLYPILAAATVIDCWQENLGNIHRRLQHGLICAAVSIVVLNAGYLLEGTGRPLGDHAFYSETLGGPREDWNSPGNRFTGTWLGYIPVPLPAAYLTGLDLQKRDFEGHWRPMYSYLRGHQQLGGWWYYYLYCLLVKIPVGTWLIAIVFAISLVIVRSDDAVHQRRETWLLWITPVVLFVFVSSQTGFSRYYRYVLPCAPFVMIGLSRVFSPLVRQKKQWLTQLAAVGLILMTAESLWVYPHSLAFFNLPSGGPVAGHLHLLDSNVDWGQDLYELRDWINRNSEKRPLLVAYSGVFDPHVMGIDAARPPEKVDEKPPDLPPGWYAISVNHLHGYDDPHGPFTYFLNRVPVSRAGYSILIYHVAEPAP